jgi:hypothetical protein
VLSMARCICKEVLCSLWQGSYARRCCVLCGKVHVRGGDMFSVARFICQEVLCSLWQGPYARR